MSPEPAADAPSSEPAKSALAASGERLRGGGALSTTPLSPFGLVVRVPAGTAWESLDPEQVHAWVAEHRVVVFRGLAPFDKPALPIAARRLGPLQVWAFGSVNELKPDRGAKNYLYTNRAVPLHWDGAFAGKVPRYLFFHCVSASEVDGGETVFVDTTRVWAKADEVTRDRWRALRFTYETRRIVHYGGSFSARLVDQHPYPDAWASGAASRPSASNTPSSNSMPALPPTNATVLRFAEPVDDLNPVHVSAEGLSPLESAAMITELRAALSDPEATLAHDWQSGDVVIADNHALLHGRRAFRGGEERHIRRVNVHGPERSWVDDVRDSIRIRRPEFMVAEIPILLIVALLVARTGTLATGLFAEVVALFFLLFHFGDMINCLADRDLDAVYKTHLSEAVKGLGTRNVKWQLAITVAVALGLAAHLSVVTGRPELFVLVTLGLGLGSQYSVGPLRLKGRGVLQVAALWAVIFVGPMLLVARALASMGPQAASSPGATVRAWVSMGPRGAGDPGFLAWLGAEGSIPLLALIGSYGILQQGIVLVNTAEDLPEDRAAGIRTTAVSLGMTGCLALATLMVAAGGLGTLGVLGLLAFKSEVTMTRAFIPAPLLASWAWVLWRVGGTWRLAAASGTEEQALSTMRPRARWMPVWITATAWTALFAAWQVGTSWMDH